MIQKIQKPFSIKRWKKGAKIETRDGRKVRILCPDTDSDCVIVGFMEFGRQQAPHSWEFDGRSCTGVHDFDLVIVEEVEEPKRWADDENVIGEGWLINDLSVIKKDARHLNRKHNYRLFASEKQAKSTIAMARISQLMKHDVRYGGVVTDEEWQGDYTKYCIGRHGNRLWRFTEINLNFFLAFHTEEQCDLFLAENEQLVKDYLMIE